MKQTKLFLAFSIAVLLCAGHALAQDAWFTYHKGQHVYVDPAVHFQVSGLESSLADASKKNGIENIFILAKKDQNMDALAKDSQVMQAWQSNPDFPVRTFLLDVVIQSDRNSNAFSKAVEPGPDLARYGINKQFIDENHWIQSASVNLPRDPSGYALAIANYGNAAVAANKNHNATMTGVKYVLILLLIILAIGIPAFLRYRQLSALKRAFKNKYDELNKKLDKSLQVTKLLSDSYRGFFMNQKPKKDKYVEETKSEYATALTSLSTMSAAENAAAVALTSAQTLAATANLVNIQPLTTALTNITTTEHQLSEEPLELSDIKSATGGVTKEVRATVSGLIDTIDFEFGVVHGLMADLQTSILDSQKTGAELDTKIQQLQSKLPLCSNAGKEVKAFEQRIQELAASLQTAQGLLETNPVKSHKIIQTALADAKTIDADISDALKPAPAAAPVASAPKPVSEPAPVVTTHTPVVVAPPPPVVAPTPAQVIPATPIHPQVRAVLDADAQVRALTAVSDAQNKMRLTRTNFNFDVVTDLSEARRLLALAESALDANDFGTAVAYADQTIAEASRQEDYARGRALELEMRAPAQTVYVEEPAPVFASTLQPAFIPDTTVIVDPTQTQYVDPNQYPDQTQYQQPDPTQYQDPNQYQAPASEPEQTPDAPQYPDPNQYQAPAPDPTPAYQAPDPTPTYQAADPVSYQPETAQPENVAYQPDTADYNNVAASTDQNF
ncbi:MAG TPA: hypothetical protein V6C81_21820 [Planktothrix sp.]|jgi:hypothetical protein